MANFDTCLIIHDFNLILTTPKNCKPKKKLHTINREKKLRSTRISFFYHDTRKLKKRLRKGCLKILIQNCFT